MCLLLHKSKRIWEDIKKICGGDDSAIVFYIVWFAVKKMLKTFYFS